MGLVVSYHEGVAVLFDVMRAFRTANIGVLRCTVFLVRYNYGI